jgi:hypothetical protein
VVIAPEDGIGRTVRRPRHPIQFPKVAS